MTRARVWLVRAAVVGAALGAAACDAASTVASPRQATPARGEVNSGSGSNTMQPMTAAADTTTECRSGYQIAYRSDGTAYCVVQQ